MRAGGHCCATTATGAELFSPRPFDLTTFPNDEGYDELVLARFRPAPDGLLDTLAAAVFKPRSTLVVTADGRPYRLPDALAGGPLQVAAPAGMLGADAFGYASLAFSRPGTVEFQVVTVDRL